MYSEQAISHRRTGIPSCDYKAGSISDECKKVFYRRPWRLSAERRRVRRPGTGSATASSRTHCSRSSKSSATQHAIIVTFVHGWKHNADYCDNNMCCFRDMLRQISKLDEHYSINEPRRRVVGVYLGWRGLSLTGARFGRICRSGPEKRPQRALRWAPVASCSCALRNFLSEQTTQDPRQRPEDVKPTSPQASATHRARHASRSPSDTASAA